MASLKEFINSSGISKFLPSAENRQLAISKSLTNVSSVSERNKFSAELSKLVCEEGFITELSDGIGKPKDNESEDEFVSRAKVILSNLLDNRLSKT